MFHHSSIESIGGRTGRAQQTLAISSVICSDLDNLVDLHMEAFEGFFLQTLGKKFLKELYLGFLRDNAAIILKAEDECGLVGFVAGSTQSKTFFRRLLFHRWYVFAPLVIAGMKSQPWSAAKKLASAVLYRGEAPSQLTNGSLLSSIAVSPRCSRSGCGGLLVNAFCEASFNAGSRFVYLITDRDDNEAVNSFYLRCGFTLESSFRKDENRWMNRFVKFLVEKPVNGAEKL